MDAPHDDTDHTDAAASGAVPGGAPGAGLPWTEVLPLTTVETFVAAMIEAGPEVAEHMVRAANELLLAAQAIMGVAERRLGEQRRLREAEEAAAADAATTTDPAAAPGGSTDTGTHLRSVDEVA